MAFDPALIKNLSMIGTALGAAFVLALWLSLIFWTWRDIRSRTRDVFMRILALLVTTILFLPGILIYFILRPSKTLEEQYQAALEEEALLQSVENTTTCPGCARYTHVDWIVCPNCHTKLKKKCHHCGQLMELSWNLCPYCETPAQGARRENMSLDEALQSLESDDYNEQ